MTVQTLCLAVLSLAEDVLHELHPPGRVDGSRFHHVGVARTALSFFSPNNMDERTDSAIVLLLRLLARFIYIGLVHLHV